VSGAKIDFFDQRDETGEKTDDLEDTQARLKVRDFLSQIAASTTWWSSSTGAPSPRASGGAGRT
jgi:hypothetical protein